MPFVIEIVNSRFLGHVYKSEVAGTSLFTGAYNQTKIDRQRSRSREPGRQTVSRLWWMVFGVETGRKLPPPTHVINSHTFSGPSPLSVTYFMDCPLIVFSTPARLQRTACK